MDQLRDYIYHHSKGVSLDMLHPTSNAVQEHIHRAYYATYQMVTLLQPHKPTLLNPIALGFKKTDELLLPVKGVKPIPEEYTILCNCKKCSNGRCACRKAGLPALVSASAKVSRMLRKLYNARIRLDRLRVDMLD